MCSGRVEPQFVLKAFKEGADGVLIASCHLGQCHYVQGNLMALTRYHLLIKMAEQFGIENERIQQIWVSATETSIFVDKVNNMTACLKALGPLKWNGEFF